MFIFNSMQCTLGAYIVASRIGHSMAQLTLGLMTHTQHAHDGEEVRKESHTLETES